MITFAVVTPTVFRDSLARAVESIDAQDYRDLIHIIVSDGEAVPAKYRGLEGSHRRLVAMPFPARNYGHSPRLFAWFHVPPDVDYVAYLDDDDYYQNDTFHVLNRFLESAAGRPDFLFFPALRMGEVFFHDPPRLGMTVSCQYVHRRLCAAMNQPILFSDGVRDRGHGADGRWIERCARDYSRVMLPGAPLVVVPEASHGTRR